MKVLDVSGFFSEACGGIKTYYGEKARLLPRAGIDAHFVVPGVSDSREPFGGGTLHRVRGPRIPGHPLYRLFPGAAGLRRVIAAVRPDVVEVASHFLLPALVRRAIAGCSRPPAVVGFFHSDFARAHVAPAVRPFPRAVGRAALAASWGFVRRQHARYASTLVASRGLAHELEARGVPRVECVGLGVDTDTFSPDAAPRASDSGPPRVVYAGRFSGEKAFDLVLDAADAIHRATGAVVLLAGDGPMRPRAERLARGRPHVLLRGYLEERSRVAALLASADVVLSPGPHESFSLATAEALACGTPVVGADAGGVGELLRASHGGVSFRAGEWRDLARRTVELLRLPARRDIGRRARTWALESLAWPRVFDRVLAVYRRVLD